MTPHRPHRYQRARRDQLKDSHEESSGAVVGTLAGAAPPWQLSWSPGIPPSQWDLRRFPTGHEFLTGMYDVRRAHRHAWALRKTGGV